MRVGYLIGPELREILREEPGEVKALLAEFHPEDVADVLATLGDVEAAAILTRMSSEDAASIFERLEEDAQEAIASEMPPESVAHMAAEMAPDDRVDLLRDILDEEVGQAVLHHLEEVDPEAAQEVAELDRWPDASAGRLMTTAYVSTGRGRTVQEVIQTIRGATEAETVNYVYVLTPARRLDGILSIRTLLLAEATTVIDDLLTENVISVQPLTDQEEVARRMAKYDLTALPVVDERGLFLGIITVDDVIDVLTEEQTEDMQRQGAVEPLENTYFATTFWVFVKKRATWLLVLFVGEFFTGNALRHYDSVLQAVTKLSFYVPLLISTGGNSGGQSSSLVIRGMAVGEIKRGDWLRVLRRELAQGLVLGLILASVGVARVLMWGDGIHFAAVIGITLVGIVTMGCTVGSMLPIGLKRLGFDPATSSAPFIASLVDVLGIVIYFNVAQILLRDVIGAAAVSHGH